MPSCRRRFILEYFGERWPEENCGACDVCLESREEFDATEIAQKILSAVVRTGERFGANHIIQARIHRRRASGQRREAARRCSCASGIMVFETQNRTQRRSTQ